MNPKRLEIRIVDVSPKLHRFIKQRGKKNKRKIGKEAEVILEAAINGDDVVLGLLKTENGK